MARVVVDTHIFIRSLTEEAEYRPVMDTIVRVRDSIVVNDPIVREYAEQSHHAGLSPVLVQAVLDGDDLLNRVQFIWTENRSSRKRVGGIPNQDLPFVVAYRASNAEYLLSEDPDFQSQRQRLRRLRPPIHVVLPYEYVSIRTRSSNP